MTSVDRFSEASGRVRQILADTVALHERLRTGGIEPVVHAAEAIVNALGRDGRVLVFGNGGSAAEAQHFAAELSGRFERDRRALAAVALTTDTSVLTAVGNDFGFDRIFARQVEALGRAGDVALAISTSGVSPNVLEGVRAARAAGLVTVALTGRDGGPLGREVDVHVNVPHASTARVQEAQLTLLHAICDLVERAVAGA